MTRVWLSRALDASREERRQCLARAVAPKALAIPGKRGECLSLGSVECEQLLQHHLGVLGRSCDPGVSGAAPAHRLSSLCDFMGIHPRQLGATFLELPPLIFLFISFPQVFQCNRGSSMTRNISQLPHSRACEAAFCFCMDGTCCPQGSRQAELGDARAARAALVQAVVMVAVVMRRHLAHRKFPVELGKRRGKRVCVCMCVWCVCV